MRIVMMHIHNVPGLRCAERCRMYMNCNLMWKCSASVHHCNMFIFSLVWSHMLKAQVLWLVWKSRRTTELDALYPVQPLQPWEHQNWQRPNQPANSRGRSSRKAGSPWCESNVEAWYTYDLVSLSRDDLQSVCAGLVPDLGRFSWWNFLVWHTFDL